MLAPSAKDFYPEDEGDMFRQYVNKCLPHYKASHTLEDIFFILMAATASNLSQKKKKFVREFDSVRNIK